MGDDVAAPADDAPVAYPQQRLIAQVLAREPCPR